MDANEKIINTFVTRVRQLMLQYEELKKEKRYGHESRKKVSVLAHP